VKLSGRFHIEDAYIRVMSNDPPQVPPSTGALQFLRSRLLLRTQFFRGLGVKIVRNVNVHPNVEQHQLRPLSGRRHADGAPLVVTPEKAHPLLVQDDAEPRAGRHDKLEVLILERLGHDFFGQ